MPRKLTWFVLFSAAIAVTALYCARNVWATPASGFVGKTVAVGRFGDIDVFNQAVLPDPDREGNNGKAWISWQKTKGASDLYVQNNTWDLGGSTGWHSHPGHSLIIVTAGAVTAYEGNDPECKPTVYTKGMGFVDPGGDHVHILRNEGTVIAQTIAVQLIPAGAARRIDVVPSPGNCPF